MKKKEEGTNAVKHCGFFLACNVVVMLKIEAKPGCNRTKGCSSARETNKNKKVTSKLEQGLNFTVKGDFWLYNDTFYITRRYGAYTSASWLWN